MSEMTYVLAASYDDEHTTAGLGWGLAAGAAAAFFPAVGIL